MNKRHFENCVSKEKRKYEANVKKYKKLMEKEFVEKECRIKIQPVPIVTSEAVASTLVGFSSTEEEPLQQTPENTDIRELLQQLVEGQKQITTRLEKIEHNHATLSQGQATLNSSQQKIANMLELIEASPEEVAIRREQDCVCRITGETYDKYIDEVASMFPLRTIEAVQEVEEMLMSSEFTQAMNTYVHKIKGISEEVGSVIRVIFTDDLLDKYNWEGRWEKLSLANLSMFNKIFRDIFQKQGAIDFEKSVRRAVERAHHRVKQKKYYDRVKQK